MHNETLFNNEQKQAGFAKGNFNGLHLPA